ncbi:MAG: ATP-binding cassette, subfamily bacterial [Acidimicrobiaceae bacterium]|nr:ATP-binding cassette, subfamily bacterial [Acidimicrobiaceae bacterium]
MERGWRLYDRRVMEGAGTAAKTGWVRRLLPFLFAHKRNLFLAFGSAVFGQVVTALTPIVEKVLIDDVVVTHRRTLAPWLTVLLLAGAARFGLAYVRRFYGGRIALDVQYDIRNAIYDRLQRLDFARHDEMDTGQLVSRANSDVGLLFGLMSFLPLMSGNIVMVVLSLVVMTALSPLLTLVALAVVPAIALVAMQLRKTLFPAAWDSQQRTAEVAGVVDEAVTGVRVVKGFGQEERELNRLVDVSRELFGSRLRTVRIQAKLSGALESLPSLGQVAILGVGGWLAMHGRISLGTFLAFSSYLIQLVAPARMFAIMLAVAQLARAGAERIFEVLDANPDVVEGPDASDLPPVHGEVAFEDVVFGYLPTEPVLNGFDLHVAAGETVALVGASGSGKSTVSLLLPRFYDVRAGAVRIDGVDVRDVTFESLRRQIGVVFEDAFLFSMSVRDNIAYGRPDATDAEIVAAAQSAEAHDFILDLPEGYDTVVGERGLTLSGGQRQRVTLARALITDPRILVLDDATSAVDARVEEEIHATLRRLMEGRTTLLVAHRRSTLRLADRIVVVDKGRVVDSGSHEELLARSTLYRQLLAGPGEDCEGVDADASLDGDSAADGASASTSPAAAHRVTAAAWPRAEVEAATREARRAAGAAALGPGPGPGGGGGGGFMGGGMALPPTPELMAAVELLPPIVDEPDVDVADHIAEDPHFTLRRFVRPFRRQLLVGFGLLACDSLLTLAGPGLVRYGIDRGVVGQSTRALTAATAAFGVVVLVGWLNAWAAARYLGRASERMLFALRVRIFSHLQRLSVDFYDREMAGRIMTRMTTDVEALSTLLQSGLINALVNLISFVGIFLVLFVLNVRLTLATLTIIPPLLVATVVFRRLSDRAYARARDRVAAVNANLQESLSGVRVSLAYSREGRNEKEFRKVAGEHLDARVTAQRLVALFFPFVEFLSEVAAAVVLGFGAHLITGGSLTRGELIAFLLYLEQLFAPIQQLSQVFDTYQQARASTAKIDELMKTPTGTPAPETPVAVGRLRGAVRLEDVHFAYPGGVGEALRGVDIDVAPGQMVALVGETGAGKSTVVKLVARFYDPTAGRVLIDGIPLPSLDLGTFRRQLGYVPQEAFLFSGTIRDNIAYGRPDAADAEVEEAARAVGAHDFIAGLAGGYLHVVTERGRSLSAGQRQLIALARARLVDPVILLLDEATSNLDLATEARVQRAMGLVARGRTTFVIAHRLPTAMSADVIVVVDDGRVVEQGTHAELLAVNGRYAQLWASFAPEPAA